MARRSGRIVSRTPTGETRKRPARALPEPVLCGALGGAPTEAWVSPYYSHAGIEIYHGDCRDVLPSLGRFDLLLTDIPYGEVNRASSGLRNLDKGSADTATVTPEWVAAQTAPLCTSAYAWCGTEQGSDLRREFVVAG